MRWRKLGPLFNADNHYPWMVSHAANPVAEHLGGDEFRVYFGSRDKQDRAHIVFIDIELGDSARVLRVAEQPVLAPGLIGAFDDSGVSMGCLVQRDGVRYLYYLGWNLGVTVPWRNSIGLAISSGPGEPFRKYSRAPILDRCEVDPFSISYPWVLAEADRWRMWYGSNLTWGREQADMGHVIKYAESDDGIHWQRDGLIALDLQLPTDYALCRPCVVRTGDLYRMWYCHRGEAYRLGYAESTDGVRWERFPERVGLDVSGSGWDSDMLAYPNVFRHRGYTYMLYNGNRYGRTGFGWAVLEDEAAVARAA